VIEDQRAELVGLKELHKVMVEYIASSVSNGCAETRRIIDEICAQVEAAVEAEREACAQVCEDMDLRNRQMRPEHQQGLHSAIRAIRARGNK
jgi:hypothetical protein